MGQFAPWRGRFRIEHTVFEAGVLVGPAEPEAGVDGHRVARGL